MSYLPPPSTLPPGSIVDSYRRDSGGSRQDKSTGQQMDEIEAFCKKHNLIHRHRFVDEAKSGGSTAGRDDFNRMISEYEIPANRPNGLLIWNYARFARDIDDAQLNKILIRKWGVVVHSLNDQIPEGDYGRFIEFFIDMSNEEKRKQTSADAKRGLRDLVQKYGCVPGTPPRGFKRTPVDLGIRRDGASHIAHRWDPDPEFTPRIQKAFEMKAAGATLNQIHKETLLYGSLNSYKTFFENELYIGVLHFGDLVIENYCPPIIDNQTWAVVQKVLRAHVDRQHVSSPGILHPRRKSDAATYLLSGIVHCSRCKSPMWGMTSGQRDGSYYLRYACTRRQRRNDCDLQPIPARALEKVVVKEIIGFFEDPNNLRDLINLDRAQNQEIVENNKSISKDILKQISTIRRSIGNITNAIAEGGHSKSMLEKLKGLEAQETELQSRLHSVKDNVPTNIPDFTEQEIIDHSRTMVTRLQSKDVSIVRRALLSTVFQIFADRVESHGFGMIKIKNHPADPKKKEESAEYFVAPLSLASVGALFLRKR